MSYTFIEQHDNGDETHNLSMRVNLLACDQCPDWALDAAYDGITSAHDEVYNETTIPGTLVQQYTTDFVATTCDDREERDDANNWLDNNGFGIAELNLFVSNCTMARTYGLAYNDRCVGFVGAGDYDEYREMEVMAIHESFHAFLMNNCSEVQSLANSSNQVDHKLGHIGGYKGSDEATPMCASYASNPNYSYASSGDCDDYQSITWGDWTKELSYCTKVGIDHTLDHLRGYH